MIDFDAINKLVEDRYISCQFHPTADLRIFNYTVKTQYDWLWNEETMTCRGLIVDGQNNIVARPFKKFFSYEQLSGVVPQEPFEVFEKLDGSLGVLYFVGNEPSIATRGSFVSPQAEKANEILRSKYSHVRFDPSFTYLFEIIYIDNRIVVDYGDTEDLFLLAVIHTATGQEFDDLPEIGFPVVKRYDGINDFDGLRSIQWPDKEGFVVRFKSGERVKMKFDEYKRLHKLLTGINARHIWEEMSAGRSLEPILERVPDEYYQWVKKIERDLYSAYSEIEKRAKRHFQDCGDRKTNALYYQTCPDSAVLFKMLDGKDYSNIIWKQIKPKAELPFRCGSEDG